MRWSVAGGLFRGWLTGHDMMVGEGPSPPLVREKCRESELSWRVVERRVGRGGPGEPWGR